MDKTHPPVDQPANFKRTFWRSPSFWIVIMFLIASATALCTVGVVLLSFLRLFNVHHQFLYRQIRD